MLMRLLGDERVRFVLVGAVNTVVGYGLFVAIELAFGRYTGYLISLYLSYAIATVIAFGLHRRYTFRVIGKGGMLLDFLRFQGVNLAALLVNTVALPLLVELAQFQPIFAQALIVIITTLISYLGHKFFSFSRRPADELLTRPTGTSRTPRDDA